MKLVLLTATVLLAIVSGKEIGPKVLAVSADINLDALTQDKKLLVVDAALDLLPVTKDNVLEVEGELDLNALPELVQPVPGGITPITDLDAPEHAARILKAFNEQAQDTFATKYSNYLIVDKVLSGSVQIVAGRNFFYKARLVESNCKRTKQVTADVDLSGCAPAGTKLAVEFEVDIYQNTFGFVDINRQQYNVLQY